MDVDLAWLERLLPPALTEPTLLGARLWEWAALAAWLLVSVALAWGLAALLLRMGRSLTARTPTDVDDALVARCSGPVRLLIALALLHGGVTAGVGAFARASLAVAERTMAVLACAWLLVRVVEVLAQESTRRLASRGESGAVAVVPLGKRVVKGFIALIALAAILHDLDVDVTGLVASLGIATMAVALAAQKTIEDVFGGITLITTRPVRVGDSCRIGTTTGVVEDIGLRRTRLRTGEKTVVSIPNSQLAIAQIENTSLRERTAFQTSLPLRRDTSAEAIERLLASLREVLEGHEEVDASTARVRLKGIGESSFDVEVFAYVRTSDGDEFLAIQEALLLAILRVLEASGSSLALAARAMYPMQVEGSAPPQRVEVKSADTSPR
jgi:MscS family membrane protein